MCSGLWFSGSLKMAIGRLAARLRASPRPKSLPEAVPCRNARTRLVFAGCFRRSLSLAGLLVLGVAIPSAAQEVDTTTWVLRPGSTALAVAREGNTIYLGGNFRFIGPSSGGGVPCDFVTGEPRTGFPAVVGRVNAVVGDGHGGWFLGGQFSHVGGQPRTHLAHVLMDGTLSDWDPHPNEKVWTIALVNGALYVGGDFTAIAGSPRAHLAAFSVASHALLAWTCDTDNRVAALAPWGNALFIGGWFTVVSNQPRTYVAQVELASGALTAWQLALDDQVKALALRDTTLYVGGYFSLANGELRRCLAAVGAETGVVHNWDAGLVRLPDWSIDSGPHVNAIQAHSGGLLVAGSFTSLGGQARRGLAQLDFESGQATPWQVTATYPRPVGAEFWALQIRGDTLIVAGQFDSLAGVPGANVAALRLATGQRLAWDPRPNDYVFALSVQDDWVFLGGWFTSLGAWVERPGLAALDASSGRVTGWSPEPDGSVSSILPYGGKVYIGGQFTRIGGQQRSNIAALDPITGQATSWNPGADGGVWTLAPRRDAVVVGGLFHSIAGRAQRGIAALDTLTAEALPWNPQAVGDVYCLAIADSIAYVGGDFLSMGGQPRRSLAAVDLTTGMASAWDPGTDGVVKAIAILDQTVYIGGLFHQVGGLPREYVAALDHSGVPTQWAPNVFGPLSRTRVHALAAHDSTVFVGGYFSGLSDESREYFAAVDSRTAAVRQAWPTMDGQVLAMGAWENVLYAAGAFGRVGSSARVGLAAIRIPRGPRDAVPPLVTLAQCAPNPVQSRTVIRFGLPVDSRVDLAVFDVQGRKVAELLSRTWQAAGLHEVSMSIAGWQPGFYLYRLSAGGANVTRRMLVVR